MLAESFLKKSSSGNTVIALMPLSVVSLTAYTVIETAFSVLASTLQVADISFWSSIGWLAPF